MNLNFKLKKKQLSILALLLTCVLCVPSAWAAVDEDPDFTYDIRSMIQMNPDFSTYADAGAPDGVIWLKRVHYDIAPNGGVERQTMWILLGREGLPSKWLSWNVPVPKDGEAEILEASVYSTAEAEKIGEVLPSGLFEDAVQSVVFSGLPEEFILVVHFREVFPERLSMDGLVWTSESLPVWETAISVAVPAGHPFYHFSSQNVVPVKEDVAGRTVYEWNVVNTAAEVKPSIRAAGRECVVFGSRDDKRTFARFVRAREEAPLPDSPQAVRDMFGGRSGTKITENVLKWIYAQPGIILTDEPRKVPQEAPWTTGEKTLLAYKWLKEGGIDSRLLWRLAYAPEDGKPVCEAAIVAPVLEVSPPDLKTGSFYCDMERAPGIEGGLSGGAVYGLQGAGDGLTERVSTPQKAADNSLSARFDLVLNEDGMITGTVRITARKEWRQFLFPDNPASGDLDVLMGGMFTQAPRYSDLTFRESGTESVLTAALSGIQAIKGTGGNHIMTSIPPLVPRWFQSLTSGPFPYSLNFPFVMDVKVVMALPASTVNALLPSPAPVSAGKVRYLDSYKLDRRKNFIAEASMTVDTTSIADENAATLSGAIQNWQTFMTRYLPVQLNRQ